jgi:hypothetical protein
MRFATGSRTPYGEEREQLQYRLGQIHQEREPCRRGRP